jgi:hypothetical protein
MSDFEILRQAAGQKYDELRDQIIECRDEEEHFLANLPNDPAFAEIAQSARERLVIFDRILGQMASRGAAHGPAPHDPSPC